MIVQISLVVISVFFCSIFNFSALQLYYQNIYDSAMVNNTQMQLDCFGFGKLELTSQGFIICHIN